MEKRREAHVVFLVNQQYWGYAPYPAYSNRSLYYQAVNHVASGSDPYPPLMRPMNFQTITTFTLAMYQPRHNQPPSNPRNIRGPRPQQERPHFDLIPIT